MMGQTASVPVGVGELYVTACPNEVLVAYGLGSCVAVAAYDPLRRLGGMAHVVLPDSREIGVNGCSVKYADVAVPKLVERLESMGASKYRLWLKLAGGAQVLSIKGLDEKLRVGERNITAVRAALAALGLAAKAEDLGGTRGRTMQLFLPNGRCTVRVIGCAEREL